RRFAGLPALLGYLKLCAASVVLDDARHRARRPDGVSLERLAEAAGRDPAGGAAGALLAPAADPEALAVARPEPRRAGAGGRPGAPGPDGAARRLPALRPRAGAAPDRRPPAGPLRRRGRRVPGHPQRPGAPAPRPGAPRLSGARGRVGIVRLTRAEGADGS